MPSSASRRALGVAAPARAHRLAHLPPPLHDLVAVQADVLDPAADLQTVLRRAAGHARTLASADTAVVELFADDGLAAMTMSAGLASASRAPRSEPPAGWPRRRSSVEPPRPPPMRPATPAWTAIAGSAWGCDRWSASPSAIARTTSGC